MKEVYTAIRDKINTTVPAIRWVDFDLGQLDEDAPPVSWPCALVDYSANTVEPGADLTVTETLSVAITVAFKLRERTHSKTNPTYSDEALGHIDTVMAVRQALEGLAGASFSGLTYTGFTRDRRSDYRVYRLTFAVLHFPEAPDSPYIPWQDVPATVGIGPDFCIHPDVQP